MTPVTYHINPKGQKTIKQISRLKQFVIISSSSLTSDEYLHHKLIDDIDDIVLFDQDLFKSLRGKRGIFTKKNLAQAIPITDNTRLILHLPFKKQMRPGEYNRLMRLLFDLLGYHKISILPVYYHYDSNDLSYNIRIGSLLEAQSSANLTRNYVLAQLNALHINLNHNEEQNRDTHKQAQIIDPVESKLLKKEIKSIEATDLVFQRSHFQVFISESRNIPHLLREIGRLREHTFREVEEGTGKSFDLDEFDLYYLQLFIWDKEKDQLVGGYRLGLGDKIIDDYGLHGVYISKLFKIKSKFVPIIQESVEMGRSFIISDYQKQRLPLFLLWRGILELLIKNPQYKYLYGPVSISKYYSNISKNLIIAFIKKTYYNAELAKLLKPRKPYKFKYKKKEFNALINKFDGEINELDQYIEDIEPGHLRLPVLIKQYIKQNARFIGFNLDPNFSDALDGFVLLNLNDFPESTMEMLKNEKLK